MKTRSFFRVLIVLLSFALLTACYPYPTPTATPEVGSGGTPVVKDTPEVGTGGTPVIADTPEGGSGGTPVITASPTITTTGVGPTSPIVPGVKPPLPIGPCPLLEPTTARLSQDTGIGFVFPSGLLALRSAPLEAPVERDSPLFYVGVVQLANGSGLPGGVYAVAIALGSGAPIVSGQLIACEAPSAVISVKFSQAPEIRNPQRQAFIDRYGVSEEPPRKLDVTIQEGRACFVVLTNDEGTKASRYCSEEGSPLSVRTRFEGEYRLLTAQMGEAVAHLKAAGLLRDDALVFVDRSVGEIEDHARIRACTGDACKADMLGTAARQGGGVAQLRLVALQNADQPNSQLSGVLRITQAISATDALLIEPGDYVVTAWTGPDDIFIGATISGIRTDGERVVDQQIPAIPPSFVPDGPAADDVAAEISAFKLFRNGPCIFQRRCR